MENFDCQACGACCIEAGRVPIYLHDNVPPEFEKEIPPRHTLTQNADKKFIFRTYNKIVSKHIGGRCKALEGEIGKSCSCTIYENRPSTCVNYIPGSEACKSSIFLARRKMEQMDYKPRGYGPNWQETV